MPTGVASSSSFTQGTGEELEGDRVREGKSEEVDAIE